MRSTHPWSPDGTKIAYTQTNITTGGYQTYVMDADGTNQHALANSSYGDAGAIWAPDGNRIYFDSTQGDGIWYYESSNGFQSGTPSRHNVSGSGILSGLTGGWEEIGVSADSNTLVYTGLDTNSYHQLWTIPASGGTPSPLTDTSGEYANYAPSFVNNSWPPSYCNTSTICIEAPSASDAPYTRRVTIGLSSSGVKAFQYCWSSTSTNSTSTTPAGPSGTGLCTDNLQTSTDMSNKKGTLNYLGVYSGSGTVWNGGTEPNSDYYLWVRSVNTNGTTNAWNGGSSVNPLKVHTPKQPVWVGVGDSYTSGHHQDTDEPTCPDQEDILSEPIVDVYRELNTPSCTADGGPHYDKYDPDFSWVSPAVQNFNIAQHAPTSWELISEVIAVSGKATSEFGAANTTPGTDAWATGLNQAEQLRAALYPRYDSWNVVSMTGGANDTSWTEQMIAWYHDHATLAGQSAEPWNVSTSTPAADCPDSDAVYDELTDYVNEIQTLANKITENLQGVADIAARLAPGSRVQNVGYPYAMDSDFSGTTTADCTQDTSTWKGSNSVINRLNDAHKAVTGNNVQYVDLTGTDGLGTDPAANGYLQLTRFYGYPHASASGQGRMAAMAVSALTTVGSSTFSPAGDTYVDSTYSGNNYGTTNPLWATSSGTRSFLRFNTNGAAPAGSVVTGATLKIYVTNNAATSGGFEVHPEDNSWTESGATWSNQPTWNSTVLATSGTPTSSSWVTIALPANAVNTTGNTSLGLRYTASGSNAQFSSREDSSSKPQLTINYAPQLTASADTYVDSNHTGSNYGSTNPLYATSASTRAFLRFSTNGAMPSGANLTSASLRIYVTNNAVTIGGLEVHPEDDSWTESGSTWSNQPTWSSTVLRTSGTPSGGSWITISLPTSAINTSGNTSLGLRYTVSGSNAQFSSREDADHKPQLILSWG